MRRVRVRRHLRTVRGQTYEIPEHWRHIAEREDVFPPRRDDKTRDMFSEVETICALASMPDGAVITGPLLAVARERWE